MSLTDVFSKSTNAIAAAGIVAMLTACPKKEAKTNGAPFDPKEFANSTYGLEVTSCGKPDQFLTTIKYICHDGSLHKITIEDNRNAVGSIGTTFYGQQREISWMLRANQTGWNHDKGILGQQDMYDCKTTQDQTNPNQYEVKGIIKQPDTQTNIISISAKISGDENSGYIVQSAIINFPNNRTNKISNGRIVQVQVSVPAGSKVRDPFDYCSNLTSSLYDNKYMWE